MMLQHHVSKTERYGDRASLVCIPPQERRNDNLHSIITSQTVLSTRTINIDGLKICVEEAGIGPDLVLIHGLGGPQMWQRLAPLLAQHFTVRILHLPGFGDSDTPRKPFSTDEYVAFLSKLFETLALSSATMLGISYGGQIAALFAARYPQHVKKLVLSCPTGLLQRAWARNRLAWHAFRLMAHSVALRSKFILGRSGATSFYDLKNRPEKLTELYYEHISRPGRRSTWVQCVKNIYLTDAEAYRKEASTVKIPTLIFWAENDRTIPSEHIKEFSSIFPHAQVKVFAQCGHSIPLEKAEEMASHIVNFCNLPLTIDDIRSTFRSIIESHKYDKDGNDLFEELLAFEKDIVQNNRNILVILLKQCILEEDSLSDYPAMIDYAISSASRMKFYELRDSLEQRLQEAEGPRRTGESHQEYSGRRARCDNIQRALSSFDD